MTPNTNDTTIDNTQNRKSYNALLNKTLEETKDLIKTRAKEVAIKLDKYRREHPKSAAAIVGAFSVTAVLSLLAGGVPNLVDLSLLLPTGAGIGLGTNAAVDSIANEIEKNEKLSLLEQLDSLKDLMDKLNQDEDLPKAGKKRSRDEYEASQEETVEHKAKKSRLDETVVEMEVQDTPIEDAVQDQVQDETEVEVEIQDATIEEAVQDEAEVEMDSIPQQELPKSDKDTYLEHMEELNERFKNLEKKIADKKCKKIYEKLKGILDKSPNANFSPEGNLADDQPVRNKLQCSGIGYKILTTLLDKEKFPTVKDKNLAKKTLRQKVNSNKESKRPKI